MTSLGQQPLLGAEADSESIRSPGSTSSDSLDQQINRSGVASPAQITSLELAIGTFCAFIGSLMLVAPHQFSGPLWTALSQYLPWSGALFFLLGVALLGSLVLGVSRRWVVGLYFAAAATPLAFVYNFVLTGLWPGAVFNLSFALGTALAPFVTRLERPGRPDSGYLFALVFGAVNAIFGLLILALPGQFDSPIYNSIRPYLWAYGAAFLLTGTVLAFVQFRPRQPALLLWTAHVAALVPCIVYGVTFSIPLAAWVGILFYCGFSPAVASLPWTGPRLRRLDPHSFSIGLSFLLAIAAALPLVAVMAVVTAGQERLVRAEVEASLESSAVSLASDVSHYVGSYRDAVAALAAYPGLLDLPVGTQQDLLKRVDQTYPDANVFSTYDASGKGIARSDDVPPLADISQLKVFQKPRQTGAPAVEVQMSSTLHVPIFAIGAPVRGADGIFAGQVGTSLRSDLVARILNRVSRIPDSRVYLVDGAGHAIAHPDQSLVASFADISSTPQVATLLASADDQGVASSAGSGGDVLAAYARVPEFGWFVVVDRPAATALAPVRAERNAAFGLLLAAVLIAVVAGTLIARRLSTPLADLSRAASRLAGGDSAAALPLGGTSEIRGLVATFGDMRDRLAARTAERERLLETVQVQNEELQSQSEELHAQSEELQTQNEELRSKEVEQERLLTEVEYRAAELSAAIEGTQAQLALLDADLNFVMVNSAYERGCGYTREELIGRNHFTLFPNAENQAIFEQVRDTGEPYEVVEKPFEFSGRPELGTTYWNWVLVPIKDQGGETRELLLSLLDVTEQVLARQRVEEAVKARDEFISIASHELKTPVTSLQGFAQLVQREFAKTGTIDPERLARAMERIEQQSKRLTRLNDQLLSVSRLQSGKLALAREEANLSSLLRGVVADMQHAHPERVIELREEGPDLAFLDPLRIEQVIVNLIDNAIKFSPQDSPVEIEMDGFESGWVRIAVRDRGEGIPGDQRGRIFERYYQAHPEQHYGGMGIGLFVSRQIVEMHGGSITVEQPGDGGSRFVVLLPTGPERGSGAPTLPAQLP